MSVGTVRAIVRRDSPSSQPGPRQPMQPERLMARELTSVEEYRRLLAGVTSEDDLLAAVASRMTLGRWRWHHIRRSDLAVQQGDPGFPDLIAVRGAELLAVELKADRGRFETGQREWLQDFANVTQVQAGVWRPAYLDDIERRLR